MRSFEERKAELLRRQELYLEKQRQKKKMLKECISGALCIVILGALFGEIITHIPTNPYEKHYTITNGCTESSYSFSVKWDDTIGKMQSSVETYIYDENTGQVQLAVCSVYESDSGQLEGREEVGDTYSIAKVTYGYYADGVEVDREVLKP